jgi:hydrogenase 3 maturation protease
VKKVVLGVGNRLSHDDGFGSLLAQRLRGTDWTAIDAGTALENITGEVRDLAPDLLVIVDAAQMGLPPGSVRRLPLEATDRMLASTHGLPLPFVIRLLGDAAKETVLIGVEPGDLSLGEGLSPSMDAAMEGLVKRFKAGELQAIPSLPS